MIGQFNLHSPENDFSLLFVYTKSSYMKNWKQGIYSLSMFPAVVRFGYASIYGELPDFSLKNEHIPEIPFVSSERPWETIFSGSSHVLPPLTKLCSAFLTSLLEKRPSGIEWCSNISWCSNFPCEKSAELIGHSFCVTLGKVVGGIDNFDACEGNPLHDQMGWRNLYFKMAASVNSVMTAW